MNLQFEIAARIEFDAAADWYESREQGLGAVFLEEVQKTLELIKTAPDRWRCVEQDVRRCLVERFPYAVLYTLEQNCILVLAVMHCSRKPGYWKSRRQ
jgi:toxin ParE1/3/4